MKRFFLLMGMMALLLGIIASCSEDEPDTPLNSDIVGDTNSSSFQTASGMIDGGDMLEGFMGSLEVGFELLDDQFQTSLGKIPGSFSTATQVGDTIIISSSTHVYTNGWHVFTFGIIIVENMGQDTIAISGTDSVKMTIAGVAMEMPDTTFDAIYIRDHYQIDAAASNVDIAASGYNSVDITGVNFADSTDFVTLNGTGNQSAVGSFTENSTTCDADITTTTTMTNIVFCPDCADDCPTSGSVSATVVIAVSCQNLNTGGVLDVNGTWKYKATISNGTVTQTFTTGNTTWTTTEECLADASNSGFQGGPSLVRF